MNKQSKQVIQAVEKQKKIDEDYYNYLIALVRAGKIEIDNHYFYFSDGDIVQILRIDMLPMGWQTFQREMDWLDGKLVEVWSDEFNGYILKRVKEEQVPVLEYKKKVHCEFCRYLIGTMYCERNILWLGISLAEAEKKDVAAHIINKNNNCPFYKRKWWLFWR